MAAITSKGSRNWLALSWGILLAGCLVDSVQADVVFDGSTTESGLQRPAGSQPLPTGTLFLVERQDGTQFGNNLLHSFERFDLDSGDSALFRSFGTDSSGIESVISRVTGGMPSVLNGTIELDGQSYPNADFLFVNPSGVLVGADASLNVPGSFFISSADELYFEGMEQGVPTGSPQVLQIAPLQSFGFLEDDPGALSFAGFGFTEPADSMPDLRLEDSRLRMPRLGETLGFAGQNIVLDAAVASAQNGNVTLASVTSPGQIDVEGQDHLWRFRIANGAGGPISLDRSVLSSSGIEPPGVAQGVPQSGSGSIYIEAGSLEALGSNISALTAGPLGGGNIEINLDGSLHLDAAGVSGSGILARKTVDPRVFPGPGNAGDIRIQARDVTLLGGAIIDSLTEEAGRGGIIRIEADEHVLISGRQEGASDPVPSGVFVNSRGSGAAGSIVIETPLLRLEEDGAVVSEVRGDGASGSVDVRVDRLELFSGGRIDSSTRSGSSGGSIDVVAREEVRLSGSVGPERFSGITSLAQPEATAESSGGTIAIHTPKLVVENGARLSAATLGAGQGGSISLDLADTGELVVRNASLITARSDGLGDAGNIRVGHFSASPDQDGKLRRIEIRDSAITTEALQRPAPSAEQPNGGNITLLARDELSVTNGEISTSVEGGLGGNIEIDPRFVILRNGRIIAQAGAGNGGNISITAETFLADTRSVVDASSQLGVDGSVLINAPEIDLTADLAPLEATYFDPSALLSEHCAARSPAQSGSFVIDSALALPDHPARVRWPYYPPSSLVAAAGPVASEGQRAFDRGKWELAAKSWSAAASATTDRRIRSALLLGLVQAQLALGAQGSARDFLSQVPASTESLDPPALRRVGVALALRLERPAGDCCAESPNQTELDPWLRLEQAQRLNAARREEQAREVLVSLETDAALQAEPLLSALVALETARATELQLADRRVALERAARLLSHAPPTNTVLFAQIQTALRIHSPGPHGLGAARDRVRAGALLTNAGLRAAQAGDDRAGAYAWGELASLYQLEGRLEEALRASRRALAAARRGDAHESFHRWYRQHAQIFAALGREEEAVRAYRRAYSALIQIRPRTVSRPHSVDPDFAVRSLGRELVDLLLRRATRADDERARSALLLEARNLLDEETAAEVQDYFQDECVAAERAVSPETIPGSLVVYPVLLDERLELIVSDDRGTNSISIAVPRREIETQVAAFSRSVLERANRRYRRAGSKLYEWLVRPLDLPLREERPQALIFVLTGELRGLPIAALYDREMKQHLIEQLPLGVSPGLSLVEPRPLPEKMEVLKAGISAGVQGFEPLPSAESELVFLDEQFPGTRLLNEAFDVESLQRALDRRPYDVIHIASHAQIGTEKDEAFLLTFEGKLGMSELAELIAVTRFRHRPLQLLSLSACRTAVGNERSALGLAGVSLKAGARSTLATLWSVNDESTSTLVRRFYAELAKPGARRALALQRAQLSLLETPAMRHPTHWAAFVMIGSWL